LRSDAGVSRKVDHQAVAAVALGGIVWFHYAEVIAGTTPSGVDEARFIAAWVDCQWVALRLRD